GGLLLLYKLFLYKAYLVWYQQHSRNFPWFMPLASLAIAPLTMATAILCRVGFGAWTGPHRGLYGMLLVVAVLIRPFILVAKPIGFCSSGLAWLLHEWNKLLLGSLVGSSFI